MAELYTLNLHDPEGNLKSSSKFVQPYEEIFDHCQVLVCRFVLLLVFFVQLLQCAALAVPTQEAEGTGGAAEVGLTSIAKYKCR